MRLVLALDTARAEVLADDLDDHGALVVERLDVRDLPEAMNDPANPLWEALRESDGLIMEASRSALAAGIVAACDRHGVRIIVLGDRPAEARLCRQYGLSAPLPAAASATAVLTAIAEITPDRVEREPGRILAVWGAGGAPGRTTLAIELAASLTRAGRATALVDADTRAPSVAMRLGLADEAPGFAAACRQAGRGGLDPAELTRLSAPVVVGSHLLEVLTGLNRPSRWPELSEPRIAETLEVCRRWMEFTVLDLADSIEADEEIVSDLDAPRRHAAARTGLLLADRVVLVGSADPVGIARLIRAIGELRDLGRQDGVEVVVNRMRTGALGIDARGQVRRAIERFTGEDAVHLFPADPRACDAALLHARPVATVAPRSALVTAVDALAKEVGAAAIAEAATVGASGADHLNWRGVDPQ